MKFEEALKLLREGKKIKSNNWGSIAYLAMEDEVVYKYVGNCSSKPFSATLSMIQILRDDWELYEEPILDKEEREYLSNVIKPFRNRVKNITKTASVAYADTCFICIKLIHDYDGLVMNFPFFKKDTMYKRMKVGRPYTLKELGL